MAIGATNYPNALDDATTLVRQAQGFITELRLPLTAAETAVPVLSTAGATSDGIVVIGGEAITYEAKSGDAFLTCVRGALQGDGYGPATSYPQGTLVTQGPLPVHHRVLVDAVLAVQGRLSALSSVRGVAGNYTLQASDAGTTLVLTDSVARTVTVPAALPLGFTVTLVQGGAGQYQVVGSGATVVNRQGHTRTAGLWASVEVREVVANVALLSGDTAA